MTDTTTQPAADTGYAPARWAFDDEVTRVFDDMLARSIPQYEVMRQTVFETASSFAQSGTDIVDLGCSRGESLAALVDRFGAHNRFVGVEVSQPMLAACRERFKGYAAVGIVHIADFDLRNGYPPVRASVTQAVLTLIFLPIQHRLRVLRDIYRSTVPGGALLLVEKVLGATADIDEMMVKQYHALKHDNGYSWDDIERKRLALEGTQIPVTSDWNEDALHAAGFRQVDCIWRWQNFAAWVAIRD
jgi:tRNA (cmo5U34)-methyltransferase